MNIAVMCIYVCVCVCLPASERIRKETKESHANLGVSRGALYCWGQQAGFLPSRNDAFYNEEVREIIMEINS